jgi:6-phosphogluconolactonase
MSLMRAPSTFPLIKIESNGALSPVAGSPFRAGGGPFSVAIDPNGKFAYVTSGTDNDVWGYTIDATSGALKKAKKSPFAAGSGSFDVAIDPTDTFAYVVNDGSNNVSAYDIRSNGALTQVAGSPFSTDTGPEGVATCRVTAGTCKPPPL